MDTEITRDVYEGEGPDGIDVRLYSRGDSNLPSVTTVLKTRDDDKSNLYAWQDRNDGEGDNAYHKHLFWYSRHVGTLGHWHALTNLDNDLEWSRDEAESLWAIKNVDEITDDSLYEAHDPDIGYFVVDGEDHEEIWDANSREVFYSILKSEHAVETWGEFYQEYPPYRNNDYYSEAFVEQAQRDIEFFVSAQQRLWSKLGIESGEIIEVEKFLFNQEYGYAGQVDLVYRDQDGDIVVADLKSSSGCYDKHQMQGAAYGKAIECADDVPVETVDRLEVHRAHPRSGQMAVHTSEHTKTQDIHTTKYWSDTFEELWRDFEALTHNFESFEKDSQNSETPGEFEDY